MRSARRLSCATRESTLTDDIQTRLLEHATRDPHAPCFHAAGRAPLSYGSLARQMAHVRDRFEALGLARGDIVVASLADRPTASVLFAAAPVASTFGLLSPSLADGACGELLDRMRARAVVVPKDVDTALGRAAAARGIARVGIESRGEEAGAFTVSLADAGRSGDVASARRDPRWAYIGVTSGTTSRPKIVPYGHAEVVAISDALGAMLGFGPSDTAALVTPMHLANAQRTGILATMINGASALCLPESDIDALLDALRAERISTFSASFTIMRALLDRLGPAGQAGSTRLRYVRVASGSLEPDEIRALERALGVPALAALATTETGILTHQRLPPAPRVAGGLGWPILAEVRFAGNDGRDVAPGEVGEVQARGPQVFAGYLDDDALNARAFVDGWFRTGDFARVGANGELCLVGRVTEVINRGGEKISPLEVDAALRGIAGVADAAAFGVSHPTLGEEVVAAVVRAPGARLRESDVVAAAGERLGVRRAPRRVWFVDALPRNEAGKVLRARLPDIVGFIAPARASLRHDAAALPPLEAAVAGLWGGVLGVASVRADERFDALGGDDALAARLVAEVEAVFGVVISPQALDREAGTVAAMARYIERAREA